MSVNIYDVDEFNQCVITPIKINENIIASNIKEKSCGWKRGILLDIDCKKNKFIVKTKHKIFEMNFIAKATDLYNEEIYDFESNFCCIDLSKKVLLSNDKYKWTESYIRNFYDDAIFDQNDKPFKYMRLQESEWFKNKSLEFKNKNYHLWEREDVLNLPDHIFNEMIFYLSSMDIKSNSISIADKNRLKLVKNKYVISHQLIEIYAKENYFIVPGTELITLNNTVIKFNKYKNNLFNNKYEKVYLPPYCEIINNKIAYKINNDYYRYEIFKHISQNEQFFDSVIYTIYDKNYNLMRQYTKSTHIIDIDSSYICFEIINNLNKIKNEIKNIFTKINDIPKECILGNNKMIITDINSDIMIDNYNIYTKQRFDNMLYTNNQKTYGSKTLDIHPSAYVEIENAEYNKFNYFHFGLIYNNKQVYNKYNIKDINIKEDTKIIVIHDFKNKIIEPAHFSHIDNDNNIFIFKNGRTSHTYTEKELIKSFILGD